MNEIKEKLKSLIDDEIESENVRNCEEKTMFVNNAKKC